MSNTLQSRLKFLKQPDPLGLSKRYLVLLWPKHRLSLHLPLSGNPLFLFCIDFTERKEKRGREGERGNIYFLLILVCALTGD